MIYFTISQRTARMFRPDARSLLGAEYFCISAAVLRCGMCAPQTAYTKVLFAKHLRPIVWAKHAGRPLI